MMAGTENMELRLDRFRKIVKNYIERHHYTAAVFWADKVVSLSGSAPVDVYWLAQSYFLTKEFHRAILLLTSHKLAKQNATCRYLAARCHYEVKEYHEALDLLDGLENNSRSGEKASTPTLSLPEIDNTLSVDCSIQLLKGYIYEANDNRSLAAESFRAALQADPLCFEAFHALTQHHMLTLQEEKDLLANLALGKDMSPTETEIVKVVYETRVKKYSAPTSLPSPAAPLTANADFLTANAEKLYYSCDFVQCYKITQEVLKTDPYHTECLPIHIACLVEMKQSNTLFLLAHKLVDLYPENALSWFAVGCYYYLIGKYDHARRYLNKATALDRVFGPAWIAYGHSFAAENEHDQAMAAYFKAAQLMRGCHLPLLYIGMEYGLTNNPKFAEKFFKEALDIAPEDPFVLHELGVVAFNNQEYTVADMYLRRAVEVVEQSGVVVVPEKWAALLNNLGHNCRKLQKYEEALHFHQQALCLCPGVSSTYCALGLVQSLQGDYSAAVVSLHKALSLHRDDTTATTLLTTVMDQLLAQTPTFEGDDNIPSLELPPELTELDTSCGDVSSTTTSSTTSTTTTTTSSALVSTPTQPSMLSLLLHSSSIGNDSALPTPDQSSVLMIEDMVMDDESP
ncbi:cell division cycle protein 16 [Oratosquilla oratoria]|uniref:cell division cycle protein 16 n=1 Tax=Oratosquilla oratoria TaxID=337810 RepID=UPI003F769B30